MLESLIAEFRTVPSWLFAVGLLLLPLGPVPISPLWLLAGVRFGPVVALSLTFVCLLGNFCLAYLMSAKVLRKSIAGLLERRSYIIPKVPTEDEVKFIFLIRLVPGNPLCVQNYLLGVLRVRLLHYLAIGIPIQMAYATGFILFGGALFEGRIGMLIFAATLIVALGIAVKLIVKRVSGRGKGTAIQAETAVGVE